MCKLGYDYSPCRRYNNRKMFWNLEENAPEVTRFISDFTKCRISLLASSPRKVHLDVAAASSHSMCILSSQAHPFPCLFTYPFAATGEAATTGPATTTGAATTKEAAATVAGCRAAGAVHSHSTQSHSTYSHLWHTHSPSNSITHLLPLFLVCTPGVFSDMTSRDPPYFTPASNPRFSHFPNTLTPWTQSDWTQPDEPPHPRSPIGTSYGRTTNDPTFT